MGAGILPDESRVVKLRWWEKILFALKSEEVIVNGNHQIFFKRWRGKTYILGEMFKLGMIEQIND